jgi:hypothetical protein
MYLLALLSHAMPLCLISISSISRCLSLSLKRQGYRHVFISWQHPHPYSSLTVSSLESHPQRTLVHKPIRIPTVPHSHRTFPLPPHYKSTTGIENVEEKQTRSIRKGNEKKIKNRKQKTENKLPLWGI